MGISRVYIRVSNLSGGKGEEAYSPDLQMEAGRTFSRLHNLEFDEAASERLMDLDQSGWRKPWRRRPGISQHLADAQAGLYNHLIVYKLSRLARNAREGLELFDLFERAGCAIHVVKEGIDTSTPVGRLVRTILLAVAEMQSEDISQFASDTIRARFAGGRPHGYPHWVRREGDAFALVEDAAEGMRLVASLRLAGESDQGIVRALTAAGHAPPRGRVWHGKTVSRLLSEEGVELLLGHARLGDGDERRVIRGVYPAVITEEEGEVLAALAASRETGGQVRPARLGSESILAGRVYCALCGSRMITGGWRAGQRGYRCERAMRQDGVHPEGEGRLRLAAGPIEDAVKRVVRHALFGPTLPEFERPGEQRAKRAAGRTEGAIAREIDALFRLYSAGRIREEDYDRQYRRLVEERETLSQEKEAPSPTILPGTPLRGTGGQETGIWRQTILQLVERVEVPLTHPDYPRSGPRGREPMRFARVTLTGLAGPRVYLSGLHYAAYSGEEVLFAEEGK